MESKNSLMRKLLFAIFLTITFSSCFIFYTFKDISIEPDVKTFYVEDFANNATNSPATLNQDFSEALRKKIIDETSLTYDENNPHVIFSGSISSFDVTAQAPNKEGASLNRLQIKINVEYVNTLHEKENWKKPFTWYADFPSDQSLDEVQESLIKEIFAQILDDIINKSFNNW